jgi:hypothetical protein
MSFCKCIKYIIIYTENDKPFQKVCLQTDTKIQQDINFIMKYIKDHPVIKYCKYIKIYNKGHIIDSYNITKLIKQKREL